MSDRDGLAEIVYNQASGCDADGNVTKRAALRTVDCIIAAGWRLVPDGMVCVSRSLVEFYLAEAEMEVKEYADAEGDMVIVLDSWTAARDELRAALEASRE